MLYPELKPRIRERNGFRATDTAWESVVFSPVPPHPEAAHVYGPRQVSYAYRETITDYPRKKRPLGKPYSTTDHGGPMTLRRRYIKFRDSGYYYRSWGDGTYGWVSQDTAWQRPDATGFSAATLLLPTYTPDFAYWGPKAFNRMKPGRDGALGQFLIELRDIPRIPGAMRDKMKWYQTIGHEYLNVEFGWKPFLKDLQKIARTIVDVDAKWRQLVHDHHRRIRKNNFQLYGATLEDSVLNYGKGIFIPKPANSGFYPGSTVQSGKPLTETASEHTITDVKYWANGAFRLLLPSISPAGIPEKDFRLWYDTLGIVPTPSLLYKVTPWSWLIDWFTNVGDILDNYEAIMIDGVAAEYLYVSCHWRKRITTQVTGPWGSSFKVDYSEVKARDQASPYGFGLSFDNLTTRQLLILGALGLTNFHSGKKGR